jgi:putative heme-binding domain-containing protein
LRRDSAPLERRAAAAALLVREPGTRGAALKVLKQWLRAENDETQRLAAVRVMVSSGDATVPTLLLRELSSSSPQTGRAVVDALLTRESWSLALMDHVRAHPATPLDSVQKARLMQSESEAVRERAVAVLKPETSRKAAIEALRPALGLKGSAVQGRALFATRCIACHEADGIGHAIGPDLKSVVSHPAEKLLTSIVDPSLDVQPGYFAFNAGLKDGSELYGIITSETGNSLTFRLPDGSERLIARSEIKKLESTGQSLMPAGLESGWSPQDIADVIAWLQSRRSSD